MKKRLLYYVFSCLALSIGLLSPTVALADELTVNVSATETSQYVPVYGYYADYGFRSQMLYTSDQLSDLEGGTISQLVFSSSDASSSWGISFVVKITETTATSLSSAFVDMTNATTVYSGSVEIANNQLTFALSTPYAYGGGNLVIDVYSTGGGTYASKNFYVASATGMSRYAQGSGAATVTGTPLNYQPKVTFTYEAAGEVTCAKPTGLAVTDTTSNSADLSWTAGGEETQWGMALYSAGTLIDSVGDLTSPAKSYTDLESNTQYTAKLYAICGSDDISRPVSVSFRTACGVVSSFPWSEDFEGISSGYPLCWNSAVTEGSNATLWASSSSEKHGGSRSMYSADANNGNSRVLITPALSIPTTNDYEVSFWMQRRSVGETYRNEGEMVKVYAGSSLDLSDATLLGSVCNHYGHAPAEVASGWYKYTYTIPMSGDVYLFFEAVHKYGSAMYIDDVKVRKIPNCRLVTDVHVESTGLNSATVKWTANSGESAWNIAYVSGASNDTVRENVTGEPEYTFSNLESGTHYAYIFSVQADCGNEQAEDIATAVLSFDTECEVKEIEGDTLKYDFENSIISNNPFAQPCWKNWLVEDADAAGRWQRYTYSSYAHNGSGSMYLSASNSLHAAIALPFVSVPEGFEVQFYAHKSSTSSADTLFVYYNTSSQSLDGAVLLDTILPAATYGDSPYRFKLPRASEGLSIIFVGKGSGSLYVDDILFAEAPSCTPVSNIVIDAVTSTSVTYSWTAGGEETMWLVDGGDVLTETTNTIYDLDPNTEYNIEVEVVAMCDEDLESEPLLKTLSFKTPCEAIAVLPYTEGFESYEGTAYNANGVAPDCWDAYTTGYYRPHVIGGSGSYVYVHEGSKALTFYGSGYCYAALPMFAAPLNTLEISFWRRMENASYGTLTLGYITAEDNNMNTFTPIENIAGVTTMTLYEKSLESLPAEAVRLVIRWYYGSQYSCCVDDVTVKEQPSCLKPSDPKVTPSTTDAVFSWNGNADDYYFVLAQGTDTLFNDTIHGASSYTVTGLEPATSYSNYRMTVVGLCSEYDHSDTLRSTLSFKTLCVAIASLPWSEGFEGEYVSGGYVLPDCWSGVRYNSSYSIYPYVSSSSYSAYEGSEYLYFYGGSTSKDQLAALPRFADGLLSNARIRFYYYSSVNNSSNYGYLILGMMSDPEDKSTFVALDTLPQAYSYVEYEHALTDMDAAHPYIAIRYIGGISEYGYAYVDNVYVSEIPSCIGAKSFVVVDSLATANSVSFAWTSDAPSFKVHYECVNDTALKADVVVNEPSLTISGLSSGTSYAFNVSVVAVCSAEDEAIDTLKAAVASATLCEIISELPWSQNFDGLTSGIPYCWDNTEGSTSSESYRWNYNANGRTGACLRFNSFNNSNGNTNILSTPEIILPEEAAQLIFWCKNPAGGDFSVLVSSNGGARQTLLSGLTSIADWEEKVVDLSSFAGDTVVFYFNGTSNYGNGDANIYLDDVRVRLIPSCESTAAVFAIDTLSTTNSVTIGWLPVSEGAQYRVVVKEGEIVMVSTAEWSDTLYTITNLSSSTNYTFNIEVYTLCDGDQVSEAREATLNMTTLCEAISTLPWSEDFENLPLGSENVYVAPLCWDAVYVPSASKVNFYVSQSTYASHGGGNKGLLFRNKNSAVSDYVYALLPEFDIDFAGKEILFSHRSESAAYSGKLSFGYLTDVNDVSTFVGLLNDMVQTDITEEEVDLSSVPAGARLAFKYGGVSNTTYYDAGVDNIKIRNIPTCHKPTTVEVTEVTTTTASFAWSGGNAERFNIIALGSDSISIDTIVNGNSFTLTGLEPATSYIYAVAISGLCSDEDRSEALIESLIFTTECEALTTLPWSEGFENLTIGGSSSAAPLCWSLINANDGAYPYIYVNTNSSYVKTGSKSLYFQSSESRYGYAVLPNIDADFSNMEIEFDFKSESPTSSGRLYLGYVTSLDESSFVQIEEYERSASWQHAETPLTVVPAGARLAFKYGGGANNYYLGIDDISIHAMPACHRPSALSVEYTANEAAFAWEGNSESYKVVITSAVDTLVNIVVVAPEYSLAVEPETYYNLTLLVQGICPAEADTLSVSNSKNFRFTTPATCPAVTEIEKSAVTENEVDFTWAKGGDEDMWYVRVIQTNVTPADTLFDANVNSNVVNVVALQPNTDYTMRVEVVSLCSAEDSSHVATANFSFTTPMSASYTEVLSLGEEFVSDFDSEEERQKWGFIGNEATNHFIFGEDANALVGEAQHGLYVSNNNATYAYTVTSTSGSATYRNFRVDLDSASVEVRFSWQANGESNYDYGRAFIVPAELEVTGGSGLRINASMVTPGLNYTKSVPAGTIALCDLSLTSDSTKLNLQTTFSEVITTVLIPQHGDYKLLFGWGNDSSSGTQKPFAVGGVSLKLISGKDVDSEVDPETGLDTLNGVDGDKAQKFIENGHVFILHHGVIYDVTGRRVELK